jgi:hypothetical protein
MIVRREDAERFIEEVRGREPGLARYLRIEERELSASSAAGSRYQFTRPPLWSAPSRTPDRRPSPTALSAPARCR